MFAKKTVSNENKKIKESVHHNNRIYIAPRETRMSKIRLCEVSKLQTRKAENEMAEKQNQRWTVKKEVYALQFRYGL